MVLGTCVFLQNSRDKASSAGLRRPYLRVVGFEVESEGPGRASGAPLTPAEEEELRRLAGRPDLYETVAKSIAPSIYGSSGKCVESCFSVPEDHLMYCLLCYIQTSRRQ